MPEYENQMSIEINGYTPKSRKGKRRRDFRNEIIEGKRVSFIVLYNNKGNPSGYTKVDTKDLNLLTPYTWGIQGRTGHNYARTTIYVAETGKVKILNLQHLLLPRKEGFSVDHKNRNRFDNRRSNLRYATPSEQGQNRKTHHGRGYCWSKQYQAWFAYIGRNNKKTGEKQQIHGPFQTRKEAIKRRKELLKTVPLNKKIPSQNH